MKGKGFSPFPSGTFQFRKKNRWREFLQRRFGTGSYRGASAFAVDSMVHFVKSISFLQPGQICGLSNSSEKISFSLPQFGHLQIKELKFLNFSNPGQCAGVVPFMVPSNQ
jgi:hypothetical protein